MQRSGKANGVHAIRAAAHLCCVLPLSILAVLTSSWLAMAAPYPTQPILLVAAGNENSELYRLAQAMEQALTSERLVPQTIGPQTIMTLSGGAAETSRMLVAGQRGNNYALLVDTNRIYLHPILGTTHLSMKDFTPIARMTTEYGVVAVCAKPKDDESMGEYVVKRCAESRFRTVKDLMDELRRDPRSVSFGVVDVPHDDKPFGVETVPSEDELNILRAVQAAGINPAQVRIVRVRDVFELWEKLVDGDVDVILTGLSDALPSFQSGAVRLLAVSAPQRLGGALASIPTWRDAGIDSVVYYWRGVFGPSGMSQEAVRSWTQTLDRMRKTPTWQAFLKQKQWFDAFMAGDDFRRSLQEEAVVTEALLRRVGLAK